MGRHHAKATSFVFQLGRNVIRAHAWHEREAPVPRPEVLVDYDDAVWIDGIDRRPKQYHQQCIGAYCLSIMNLCGFCRLEWSKHKDYKCWVVLLPDGSPQAKEPCSYTQFRPFEPWRHQTDAHGHELVQTSLGTNWEPTGWHFTGLAPSANEDRLWHFYQDRSARVDGWQGTEKANRGLLTEQVRNRRKAGESYEQIARNPPSESLLNLKPTVYQAQADRPAWVDAVGWHESHPYRINKEMLTLMEELEIIDEARTNSVSFLDEARRLAEHPYFYQRMHLDFRGRMYTSRSLVNYQGDDEYRCLIEFARGEELNAEGYEALLFHAANLWEPPELPSGELPKFLKKVAVGKERLEQFIHYAENPVETYDEWRVNSVTGEELADPLLFIRACMELRDATTKKRLIKKKGYVTHLPVEVDQTNSVIQHLALLYGDRDVAEMCNLMVESDFYTTIANGWQIEGLSDNQKRTVVKKIVVPRCYGAGYRRIAQHELDNLSFLDHLDIDGKRQLALQGIRRVEEAVPSIRTYRLEMKDICNQWGCPPDGEMAWATMSGFEVHFRPVRVDQVRFRVPKSREERYKRIQLSAKYVTPILHETELRRGVQANLVHSVDAALAHMTVLQCGFPIIAVHDAFACHANNINALRERFAFQLIFIHASGMPLQMFRRDVLGEPSPEGLLGYGLYPELGKTMEIVREVRERAFLEMIG